MNIFNIEKAFLLKKERKWDTLYWAIDFHDTLFKGKYDSKQSIEIYPLADLVLVELLKRGHTLIAYTSTPIPKTQEIVNFLFSNYEIYFKYINENPDYKVAGDYADFSKKFYYNILLDDKAGFDPTTDWKLVLEEVERVEKLNR